MRIDAHQHFWDLDEPFDYDWLATTDHAPINEDFLPEDLEPHLDACGIERSIVVQTQHDLAETRWMLDLAGRHEFVAGVVGWVDLAGDRCEEQIEEFRVHPKFVGVRHLVQDEPDNDFVVRPQVVRGLKVLEKHRVPFDLLFREKHLRHAPTLAMNLPELKLVVDHLAKPRVREGLVEGWDDDLHAAAAFETVYCKLSGLVTEADWETWNKAHLRPYVETALDAFGPRRCMYGSDWPVCELAGPYEEQHAAMLDLLGELSEAERDRVLGGTAAEFYGV